MKFSHGCLATELFASNLSSIGLNVNLHTQRNNKSAPQLKCVASLYLLSEHIPQIWAESNFLKNAAAVLLALELPRCKLEAHTVPLN